MKRQITLYGDGNLIEAAKAKGINLSRAFNNALSVLINFDMPDKEEDQMKTENKLREEVAEIRSMLEQKKHILNEINEEKKRREKENEKRAIKRIVIG